MCIHSYSLILNSYVYYESVFQGRKDLDRIATDLRQKAAPVEF